MNKLLRVPIDIKVINVPAQFVLSVFVHKEAIRDLCLGLCLLNERLIELLIATDMQGKSSFKLRLKAEQKSDPRARISSKSQATTVELTETGVKYLLHFLLRYYRDGVADVDHVDIEAIDVDSGGRDAYLTVKVADSLPPVSPEEAKKRLMGRR